MMKGFKKAMKGIALSLAVSLSVGSIPQITANAAAPNGQAIGANDFLRAEGKNLLNGAGEIVQLKGTNAGGYLLQEFWMTPTADSPNVHAEMNIYDYLTEKFGKDEMLDLIDIYQKAYWSEADFDNCKALGINCIRLPFWYRNLVDEEGQFYGYVGSADDSGDSTVSGNNSTVSGNDSSVSGNNSAVSGNDAGFSSDSVVSDDDPEEDLSIQALDGEDDPYAEAFALFDWFIAEAKERGMYVILDFHGAPGSQNGSDHSGVDGGDDKAGASEFFKGDNAEKNQELYYQIWEVIAERYKDEPAVAGYDLLNEPYCTYRYEFPWGMDADALHTMLWNIYDKAYDTIRAVDPNHVIIMEATWDPVDLPNPLQYGWSNVMYEYHNYLYDDYDNADGRQISNMQSKLNAIAEADYNVPSYMGEFSYFNSPEAWDEGMELLANSGINFTTWTYKTVSSYGMWGLYHHTLDEDINLEEATYDKIKEHWGKVGDATENKTLTAVVEKWFKTPSVPNTLAPEYADLEDGDYYLVNSNTQLVLTSGKAGGALLAVTDEEMDATVENQKFTISNNADGTVSFKVNDKYVSVTQDGTLQATADGIGANEKFYLPRTATAKYVLKSYATSYYVDIKGDDKHLVADSYTIPENAAIQIYNRDKVLMGSEMSNTYSGWKRYESEDEKVATIHGAHLEYPVDYEYEGWEPAFSGGNAAGGMDEGPNLEDVKADWSNVKYVEFTVKAAEDGEYHMALRYNGNDDKTILVKVNDGEQEEVRVPSQSGAEWNTMLVRMITVDLKKGNNTIRISGTINGEGWMNLDCIDIVNHPIKEAENSYLRYEAENYYTTANVQTQSFFSGGKGVGNAEADTEFNEVAKDWSNVKYVDFTIYVEEENDYTVSLGYSGNNKKGIESLYRIKNENDTEYGENQLLTLDNAGGDWNVMRTHEFVVHLKKGFNSLQMSGTINSGDYINLDYVDVRLASIKDAPEAASGWTRYEAESAARQGGQITEQDFYSWGKGVEKVDNPNMKVEDVAADWSNINYVAFTVDAPRAGDYKMVIAYNGDDDKVAVLKVNDGETQTIEVPNVAKDHNWDLVHEKYVEVTLAEGQNTVYISGAVGDGWMNLDYIDVCNNPISFSDMKRETERYEAEFYKTKSGNNPAVEVQDSEWLTYSGPNYEGVGGMGATYNSYTEGDDILGTAMNYTNFTIYATEAGEYKVVLMCNGADDALQGAYQLNDNPSVVYEIPGNADYQWNDLREATFTVKLQEGFNKLIIAGTWEGPWLNFDCIDVTPIRTEEGELEIDTDSTGMMTLPDNKTLEEAVLSSDDYKLLEEGVNITVSVNVEEISEPSTEDVSAINEVKSDRKIGAYLDISIVKRTGRLLENIEETSKALSFTLTIPENLRKEGRSYSVIRVHDGEAEVLKADFDATSYTITFATDKFSTYAMAYKDDEDDEDEVGEVEIKNTDSTGMVSLPDNKALEEAVLTLDDYKLLEEGINITINVNVKEISEPSAKDKSAIDAVKSDKVIGAYLDISIVKCIGLESKAVQKTSKELSFTLTIPENLRKEGRIYSVIRVHDDKAEGLDVTFGNASYTITFATDRFSTYAIAYVDGSTSTPTPTPAPTEGDNNGGNTSGGNNNGSGSSNGNSNSNNSSTSNTPASEMAIAPMTGDDSHPIGWLMLTIISAAGLYYSRKKYLAEAGKKER